MGIGPGSSASAAVDAGIGANRDATPVGPKRLPASTGANWRVSQRSMLTKIIHRLAIVSPASRARPASGISTGRHWCNAGGPVTGSRHRQAFTPRVLSSVDIQAVSVARVCRRRVAAATCLHLNDASAKELGSDALKLSAGRVPAKEGMVSSA